MVTIGNQYLAKQIRSIKVNLEHKLTLQMNLTVSMYYSEVGNHTVGLKNIYSYCILEYTLNLSTSSAAASLCHI